LGVHHTEIKAAMPGLVVKIIARPGAEVHKGEPVMILEAMKMEHTITAPNAGRIVALHFAVGDLVAEGAELLAFEAAQEGAQ